MTNNKFIKRPKMRVGTDDFKNLLLNSDIFVDKSLLIKEILENSGSVILITRPRRWGKSLNMSMIKQFFEIEVDDDGNPLSREKKVNRKLFSGGIVDLGIEGKKELKPLKISNDNYAMVRQGNYPVMLINFKSVRGNSYDEILAGIKSVLRNTFQQHEYLSRSKRLTPSEKKQFGKYIDIEQCKALDDEEVNTGLRFLSQLLYEHFGKRVYLLIDEYDAPINSSYIKFSKRPEEFELALEIFRGMLGSGLKSNPYLERGIITGILRIDKANLFSDLNNVSEYTLLDKDFHEFYGFTQAEVEDLLLRVPIETSPDRIKYWYNGYTFGGETVYNPWSIMMCLAHEGKLDNYWVDSGGNGLIDKVLLEDGIQEDIQKLAAGEHIISPITKKIIFSEIYQPITLYSLLLFGGYLNPLAKDLNSEENIYELSAPNKEVRQIYQDRMLRWVTEQLRIDSSRYYSLISLLPDRKIDEFKEKLKKLLLNSTSFYQTGETKAELFYSGFILGLVHTLAADYIIDSEKETGSGRADIILILIPKLDSKYDNAIIMEYKVAKDFKELATIAQKGLAQIDDKKYDAKVKENKHIKNIIKLSLVFCGKEIELVHKIEENINP